MINLLAATRLGNDPLQGFGEIGQGVAGMPLTTKVGAFWIFRNTLSLIIGVITVIGFIWFFFSIVIAAIGWLASGGDKNKVQEAQKHITNSIIGLVILISSTFLVRLLEIVLGIDILGGIWNLLP